MRGTIVHQAPCRLGPPPPRTAFGEAGGGAGFLSGVMRKFGGGNPFFSWVVARVKLLKTATGNVYVDLCGGNITVSKQHLHHSQIRSVIEEVRRKRMTQCVR